MENPIIISNLNDFIFCPLSICFHSLYENETRLQYSVFEIINSPRVLENITIEIENNFAKDFSDADSVYIFNLSKNCKITKFGYAVHEDTDLIIVK